MPSKFHIGDKIKVVGYGHVGFYTLKGKYKAIDMCPEIVGQEGIIQEVTITQDQYQYSVNGIAGKHAWYDEAQLELVK